MKYKARVPVGFRTDSGELFDIRVKKTTIRAYWIELIGTNKTIKVKKKNKKLVWSV